MKSYHTIILGAGIIGLATAYQILKKDPSTKLAILEKESEIATHQTGHNSGVIHTGIYYKPGSLKAKNCVKGVELLLDFCQKHDIPYNLCGKLIVATTKDEIPKLHELYQRGVQNGVQDLKLIKKDEIRKIEPFAKGIEAIHSPNTGIVDYKLVSQKLLEEILNLNGTIHLGHKVLNISENETEIIIQTNQGELSTQKLINCCGLYSDVIARKSGFKFKEKIIPFRGEYYFLDPKVSHVLNGLIYPVPNPKFPFLGVHLTKRISGEVEVGPNAVLALAKEGYSKKNLDIREIAQYANYSGFWAMSARYWKVGLYELYRSYSKQQFLKDIQKLVPEIQNKDLKKGGSGVRAQVVSPIGKMVDDFLIVSSKRALHVLNAPSPGATSSLAIGEFLSKEHENLTIKQENKKS